MCGNVGKCGGILWRVPRQQVVLHLLVDSPTTQLPPTRPLSNYHANGNEERDDENKRSKQLLTAHICCWQLKTVFYSSKQLFRPPDPCPTIKHANGKEEWDDESKRVKPNIYAMAHSSYR